MCCVAQESSVCSNSRMYAGNELYENIQTRLIKLINEICVKKLKYRYEFLQSKTVHCRTCIYVTFYSLYCMNSLKVTTY